jgi:hypothetical protein
MSFTVGRSVGSFPDAFNDPGQQVCGPSSAQGHGDLRGEVDGLDDPTGAGDDAVRSRADELKIASRPPGDVRVMESCT